MKKLLLFLLLYATAFLLIGCTTTPTTETPEPTPSETPQTVYHVITFEVNGGSELAGQVIEEGGVLLEPQDPTKEGHTFAGWYTTETFESGTQFDFESAVTENITLYARWTEVEIEMTEGEKLLLDIAALDFGTSAFSLDLPSRGEYGTAFTWSTSDATAITRNGVIIPDPIGGNEKMVTISLSARNGSVTETFTYDFTVKPKVESYVSRTEVLPFESLTDEFEVADGELTTYYVDEGNVPYVSLVEFMGLLDGFIYSEELEYLFDETTQILTINYSITYDNDTEDPADDETYHYEAILDFNLNTIFVEDTLFFSGYIYSTSTDFSAGLTYLDEYYVEEGDPVTYDLNAYRFDMIVHEGAYILPFHIVNLLFTGSSYYNVYYNGDSYKGIYAFGDEPEDFKTSSLNGVHAPADVRLATFDAFAFTLDYFYGLKEVNGIETYYDELYPFTNTLLGRFNASVSSAYNKFFLDILDELHSSMIYASFYHGAASLRPSISLLDLGPRYADWYNTYQAVSNGINSRWGSASNIEPYRVIEGTNTAIIYLGGFRTKTVDDPESVVDSNDYMRDAIAGILAENPNIENIIVDLSFNTGGNLGALFRVLGYITDNPIASNYQNPLTNKRQTYFLEVDTVAVDVNWFFMTSKVSFSAANLMAAIGKYQGMATLIGTTSGGGASSIIPIILPDGSFYQISSLNVLSYRTGSDEEGWTYVSLEYGVEPDYFLAVTNLTNDAAIAQLIDQINEGTAEPFQND